MLTNNSKSSVLAFFRGGTVFRQKIIPFSTILLPLKSNFCENDLYFDHFNNQTYVYFPLKAIVQSVVYTWPRG